MHNIVPIWMCIHTCNTEAGHICLERMVGDTFPGTDELFGASVEGLAATPALAARKGMYRCLHA
jgi:hypothetical protein